MKCFPDKVDQPPESHCAIRWVPTLRKKREGWATRHFALDRKHFRNVPKPDLILNSSL